MTALPAVGNRVWYREPMMWLVVAVPTATVIAGFLTLGLAIRSGGNDVAPDAVRRTAQIQQTDLAADRQALQRGLSASVLLDAGRISVQVAGIEVRDALTLRLVHPSDSSADRQLTLQPQDDRWSAASDAGNAVSWSLQLQPDDASWRLDGMLAAGQTHAVLSPRFGDD